VGGALGGKEREGRGDPIYGGEKILRFALANSVHRRDGALKRCLKRKDR